MGDNEAISPHDLCLAVHGTVLALITALARSGHLQKDVLLLQLRNSALVLHEDGNHPAAAVIESQVESLRKEWGIESSGS